MNGVQTMPASLPSMTTDLPQRELEEIRNQEFRTSAETVPTPHLRRCLDKARCLAAVLNHPQLDTVHVVTEIALDPCGRRALRQNGVDPETAHANSLDAVKRIQATCPGLPQEQLGETHDLLNVWRGAAKIVAQRDELQETSIDDFVRALISEGSTSLEIIKQAEAPRSLERALAAIEAVVASSDRRSSEASALHLPKPAPGPASVFRQLARVAGFAVLSIGAAFVVYLSH
jgi:ATP-dependent Clp protease ATP-binding subunit ClpA